MAGNGLKKFLDSSWFKFGSCIISAGVAGGTFVSFMLSSQIEALKESNSEITASYLLKSEMDKKECELEQDEMRISIEKSVLEQYNKLDGKSKEAKLFLETYEIIKSTKQ